MSRALVLCAAVAAAAAAVGCGGGGHPDDAPVRALLQRYLNAMVAHDWASACALLTPEAAQARHRSAPSADCPGALAFEAGAGLSGVPNAHPERAGEELRDVHIRRIEMHGDRAQLYLETPPEQEFVLLAVRRSGAWLLAQDLEPSIPLDASSGTLY